MRNIVHVKNVVKKYRNQLILNGLSFSISKGNFISILGPNGCGKSTLIRIISNLEKATEGEVYREKDTRIGFVFQNYNESLLPWRNVFDNVKLPLEISNSENADERVNNILKELNLFEDKEKFPFELSGGLAQLTAIARSLANSPKILILDEPFKSLDFDVAEKIIKLILRYCEKKSITTLLVSHDIDQAILFADKVLILSKIPSSLKEIIEVRLDRPRKMEVLNTKDFFKIKSKVFESLKNET